MRYLLTLVLFAGLTGLLSGCGEDKPAAPQGGGAAAQDAMKKMEEQMKGMKPTAEQIKAMQEKGGKAAGAASDEGKADEEKPAEEKGDDESKEGEGDKSE